MVVQLRTIINENDEKKTNAKIYHPFDRNVNIIKKYKKKKKSEHHQCRYVIMLDTKITFFTIDYAYVVYSRKRIVETAGMRFSRLNE